MTAAFRMAGFAAALLAPSALAIELSAPVACPAGMVCPVQNLFDHDPGPGVRDFRCAALGYDGHNGVDIRLPSMAAQRAGVEVRAAADGVVVGSRDGMADLGIAGAGRDALKSIECGNGVVIRHREGFDTQYCHMARGSVLVRKGDEVSRGQALGRVGLSGMTEFPHLHFTLRKDGKAIDPYAPGGPAPSCGPAGALWSADAGRAMRIDAPLVLNAGFSAGPVPNERIESGEAESAPVGGDPPALVAYGRVIGLASGDAMRVTLRGPDGRELARNEAPTAETPKAQWSAFAGVRRPAAGWAPGRYVGVIEILRGGRATATSLVETSLAR